MESNRYAFKAAVQDFRSARRRAILEEAVAKVSGNPMHLLSFEEIRGRLSAYTKINRGLEKIPLASIIGSVGRYTDFTRSFLPRKETDAERWAKIKVLMNQGVLPPIEVYQLGGVYFVLDGNHRVSVARSLGQEKISAYVTEIKTNIHLSPDDDPDDIILKIETKDFLENTNLITKRPEADLTVTEPGQYVHIQEEIIQHTYSIYEETGKKLTIQEGAVNWYDNVYLPVIRVIRRLGILNSFPGRTETDLYVWILRRREEIQKNIGWKIGIEATAGDLLAEENLDSNSKGERIVDRILNAITPDNFNTGPKAGTWREFALATHNPDHLFTDILVPVSGKKTGWLALEQAIILAKPEGDRIHGLHVTPSEKKIATANVSKIKAEFEDRCQRAGVPFDFSVRAGKPAKIICDLATWVDLIIINVAHPPDSKIFAKMGSGLHTLIHRCGRPILTVPQVSRKIQRIMLAYDGSPKSTEALYIATYLAGKWGYSLDIITIDEPNKNIGRKSQQRAKKYLNQRNVSANFINSTGNVGETILSEASVRRIDMLIMGGYGFSPVAEVVLGSAVDRVLREAHIPVMFCR